MPRLWPSVFALLVLVAGCKPQPTKPPPISQPSEPDLPENDVVEEVRSGGDHSCARYRSGHVACWGAGSDGQLGLGSKEDHARASVVPGIEDAVGLALGRAHTCVLRKTGQVECWGRNAEGQLGDGQGGPGAGSRSRAGSPVRGLNDVIALASGSDHVCAVRREGALVCWGDNRSGQQGNRQRAVWPAPVAVAGVSGVAEVTAGDAHTCVRRREGSILCWGRGEEGQLGDGGRASSERPRAVPNSATAVEIAAGHRHTCMRLADRSVWCWGANESGQVQPGVTDHPVARPARTPLPADAVAVRAGERHTCALTSDGRVTCWGTPADGRLGTDATSLEPARQLVPGLTQARGLAVGTAHACAVTTGGRVYCWGRNRGSALGSGEIGPPSSPDEAQVAGLDDAASVVAGDDFACARRSSGTVACWGRNDDGQLGDGTRVGRRQARDVQGLTNVTHLAAGADYACAVTQGRVLCWGDGHGPRPQPVAGLRDMAFVTAGRQHACALDRRGSAWCWGDNAYLQLGNATPGRSPQPVRVDGLPPVSTIAAGAHHTCAATPAGVVYCWGRNSNGQIGNAAGARELETPLSRPQRVQRVEDATALALGDEHSCALRRTGAVACWGRNQRGQLGAGVESDWSTRVPARDLQSVVALAAGPRHTCAALSSGAIRCWGENRSGALGQPGAEVSRVPIEVPALAGARGVAAGSEHSCALRGNGHIVCWGGDTYGQLGDGRTPYVARPQPVVGLLE